MRKILAQRIRGVSHTDPFAAEKMLEDNKAALGGEYDQLEGEVQTMAPLLHPPISPMVSLRRTESLMGPTTRR